MTMVERNSDEFKKTVGKTIKPGEYALNALVAKFDSMHISDPVF